jgi:hypothetical protein
MQKCLYEPEIHLNCPPPTEQENALSFLQVRKVFNLQMEHVAARIQPQKTVHQLPFLLGNCN